MEANELRIGNIVKSNTKSVFIIGEIYKTFDESYSLKMFDDKGYYNCPVLDASPVPLTKEILLECRFQKVEYIGFYEYWIMLNNYLISIYEDKDKPDKFYFMVNTNQSRGMETIHQIQNLCFTLTGKELDVSKII